ncbi:MAG: hypothetical protein H0X12_09660 [Nocardioides sp.]|nr:hypothetical protein [Nocardioides sp.]
MRRTTMGLLGLCLAAVTLTGCSDDAKPADEPSGDVVSSVDITFSGDTVEPNGERIEIEKDVPLTLNVTADAPGEIHVHSNPEQEFEYDEGETELELTIDAPGVVEVESHTLEKTILQLEVR